MEVLAFGEDALIVNFEQQIALEVSEKVGQLNRFLKEHAAICSLIPAYCSLTVVFDKQQTNFETLSALIRDFSFESNTNAATAKTIHIPVCYAPEFGLDLATLAEQLGISTEKLIQLHTEDYYHTYMIGFLPGFPYLGKTAEQLSCKRLAQPRKKVAAGSVGLAGNQTGIYPIDAPGGWQIIGKTPLPIFQPNQQSDFLLEAGDKVKFSAISMAEYQAIAEEIKTGSFKWEEIYE